MSMTFVLLADVGASITDFKRDPMAILREGGGETVVILNRNEPVFYAVPPAMYGAMLDAIDDTQLADIVRTHRSEPTIRVAIDGLIK